MIRRPLQPPASPDAAPMPEGDSRQWLRHPGPAPDARFEALPCRVSRATLSLRAGDTLLEGVAREMEALGAEGGLAFLDGLALREANFVIPDGPADDEHAAWYSETLADRDVCFETASASIGKRDGQWFVHAHARWRSAQDRPSMGHLLCDRCVVAADFEAPAILTRGARLEVALDAETRFPLFRPRATENGGPAEAVLLAIRPHADICGAVEAAAAEHGIRNARIHGIGSLIGARFRDGPPMTAPVSEVVVLPGASLEHGNVAQFPIAAVDHEGQVHTGDLAPGFGPVCVTCELLIVAA